MYTILCIELCLPFPSQYLQLKEKLIKGDDCIDLVMTSLMTIVTFIYLALTNCSNSLNLLTMQANKT